jgi:Trp operon repressor
MPASDTLSICCRSLQKPLTMPHAPAFPVRKECPPGACVCERELLLDDPQADLRILRLTKDEEKRLVERIEAIATYAELMRIGARLQEQLGITISILPGSNEVRTVRGFQIELEQKPGLCRKTRQAIPAAIRRCLDSHPEIAWAILNANDLLAGL